MRSPSLVLLISDDGDFAEVVRDEVGGINDVRLRVFRTVNGAIDRSANAHPKLILVHLNGHVTDAQISFLLGKTTGPPRPITVMAVADEYEADHALRLFQMGVTEYVSRADHSNRIGALVAALLPRQPARTAASARSILAGRD